MERPPCRHFFRVGSLRLFFTGFFYFAITSLATAQRTSDVSTPSPAIPRGERAHLSVGAAANLVYVLDKLNAAFMAAEPELKLTATTGASGSLVAQIQSGAPFDIFLSADLDHPRALVERGHAEPNSFTTFAIGRLVLWTTNPQLTLQSVPTTLRERSVRRIAVANPETAPYGRAAEAALKSLGVWEEVQRKLVFGENITQTAQFVETGNAEVGLVALSLVLSPALKDRGRWIPVPAESYTPLAQAAVLTHRGAKNPTAVRYLTFLQSAPAQEILHRFGYRTPAEDNPRR